MFFCSLVDLAILCLLDLEDLIMRIFQVHFFGLNLVFYVGFDLSNSLINFVSLINRVVFNFCVVGFYYLGY